MGRPKKELVDELPDLIPLNPENLLYIVQTYREDPQGFLQDILRIEVLDKWQIELCNLIKAGKTRIAIASCNGSGKSFITSALELWWLITHPEATISVCGASFDMTVDVHMRVLRAHIARSLIPSYYDTNNSLRIKLPGSNDEAFISIVSNNKSRPEVIAGRHQGSLLTVFDEASGIHPEIYMAQEGNMTTAGATWIVIGNPISTGTAFHEIFKNVNDNNRWVTIHIDARDCMYTDKEWIQSMFDTYGIEDDRVRARVLGQFPKGSINNVVSIDDYDSAERRPSNDSEMDNTPVVIGLDVAGRGMDSTVICARKGNKIVDIREIIHKDNFDLADRAQEYFNLHRASVICIDYTGGYGAGPGDILKRVLPTGSVRDVVFSAKSSDPTRWLNTRAELWMKYGTWIKTSIIPTNKKLRDDSTYIEWWLTSKGQVQVESKDDIKARIKRSTDWADSVICSLFVEPSPQRVKHSAQSIIHKVNSYRKGANFC